MIESIHTWSKCSKQLAHMDVKKNVNANGLSDDSNKACEVALGSYCIWRNEQREVVADATVRVLKNQLFLARAYYPSIIKHRNREKLQQELKKHIQDIEHMLSEATADADLSERSIPCYMHGIKKLAIIFTFPFI